MKKSVLLLAVIILTTVLSGFGQSILYESFESMIVPPANWTAIAESSDSEWNGWTASSTAHSGEWAAYISYATPSHSSYLITPQLNINGHYMLSFWFASDYTNDAWQTDFTLEISTTGNNPSDFTVVSTLEFPSVDDEYVNVIVDLSQYIGQDIYIAFHIEDAYGTGVFLDDIDVYEAPSCMAPIDVTVTEVNAHDITLHWTETPGTSSYIVQYVLDGQSWDNADSVIVTGDSAILTGLQGSSEYEFRIRAICDEGVTSSWSNPFTFSTECEAILVTSENMWLEDFEGIQEEGIQPLLNCWDAAQTSGYGAPFLSCNYLPASHSGVNSLELKGNNGETCIVVLPQFENNINTLRLNFFANTTAYALSYCGTLQVGYITDVNDPSTFTVLETVTPKTESLNRTSSAPYGPFDYLTVTNPQVRMAIRYTSTTYNTSWNLDDVTVSLIPECAEPTLLTATNLQSYTADLSWAAQENQLYDILYWVTGTTDTTIVYNVSPENGPITVDGLSPLTEYTWKARAICSDTSYSYSISLGHFTTLGVTIPIPYEQTFEDNPAGITDFVFSGTGTSQWYIGPATGTDEYTNPGNVHSLYISDNQGVSNHYSGGESYAYAVLNATFPVSQMEYHLGFDFKVNGEPGYYADYDFFSVYLVDGDVVLPTNQEPSGQSLLYHITGYNSWGHADLLLPNVSGTTKKIVFYWENDGYIYQNPPAAVDNITITGNACARPSGLAADEVLANEVSIHWQENGVATSWKVHYKPSGNSSAELQEVIVTDTPATTLTGLASNTKYLCFVTALCEDEEESSHSNPLSFRTPCGEDGITILPYVEDFSSPEQTGNTTFDWFVPCWTRYYSNSGHKPYVNTEDVNVFGSECLDFNYTPSCSTIAILPMIGDNIPINSLMINFDVRRHNPALGTLEVGIMTDPAVVSTFTPIDTVHTSNVDIWESYTLFCDSYTGEGKYIAFRTRNAGNNSVLIDNLTVDYMPSCLPVTNISVSDITETSATISWNGNGTGYKVFLTGSAMTNFITEESTITLTDLIPSSSYGVYIITLCDEESSTLSSPLIFNTACGYITITDSNSWKETFENYQGNDYQPLSSCWATPVTAQPYQTTFPAVQYNSEVSHSGNYSVKLNGYNNMLVLPTFSNDINTLRLSFWANTDAANSSYAGLVDVGMITNLDNPQSFVPIATIEPTAFELAGTDSPNADHITVDLNTATPEEGARIALRYTNNSDYYSWNIDDFMVTLIPDCPSPVKNSVTFSNVAAEEVTVSWVDNMSDHDSWTIHYKPFMAESEEWQEEIVSETQTTILTGLTPNTLYALYVTSNCADATEPQDATYTKYFTTTLTASPIPYSTDFSQSSEWVLNNGAYVNQWMVGSTTPTGSTHALFVSGNGVAPSYDDGNPAYITAEKLFTVGENPEIVISFDVKVGGEFANGYDYDFMKLFFAPATTTYTFDDYYTPTWSYPEYSTYAYDFSNYISQTSGGTVPYKLSMTNGNTIHIEAIMPNPNPNPTPASVAKLVFAWINDNISSDEQPGPVITNLSVDIVSCPQPSALSVENIGNTYADITWQAYAGQDSWVLEYKPANSSTWTSIPTNSNEHHIIGLTPATTYNVRVATDCGDGTLSVWTISNFQTGLCEAYQQCQYTLYMADSYGDGWNGATLNIQQDGITVGSFTMESGYTAQRTISLCQDMTTTLTWSKGSFDAECSFYLYNSDNIQIFNSPVLSGTSSGSVLFTFTPDCGPVIVDCEIPFGLLASYIDNTTAFIDWFITGTEESWVLQYTTDTMAEWISEDLEINLYDFTDLTPGTTYYVRVKAQCGADNESDWSEIYSFTTTGGNVEPVEPLIVTQIAWDITDTSAELNGAIVDLGNQTILSRGFEWKVSANDEYNVIDLPEATTTLTYLLTGLTPNTEYTYRAFVTTVNTTTYGGLKHFTTLGSNTCEAPTDLAVVDTANESVTLTWTDNADASSWEVRYREGTGTWNTKTANAIPYTLTGLTGLTTYEIQVMADCGNDNNSEWSSSIFVTTKNVGIPEHLFNSIVLYPNPAKRFVDVRVDENVNVTNLEVYDVFGKLVNTVNVVDNPTRINISGLANGMYFVRVTTDEGVVTKQFIKK